MDLSLGQGLLQQTQQGPIQPLEDAEREQSLAKFWGQAPLLLLQQLPDHSKVLSELQRPLQAEGQGTVWPPDPPASRNGSAPPIPSLFFSSIHPPATASFSPHLNRIPWVRMWSSQAPRMAVSTRLRAGAWACCGSPCSPCNTGSSTLRTTSPAYSLGMLGSSGVREEKGQDIRLGRSIKPLMEHLGEEGRISG